VVRIYTYWASLFIKTKYFYNISSTSIKLNGQQSNSRIFKKYQEQLISLQHKSQEAFETQLSYVGAGSLALSVGFIKDVIRLR